MMTPDVIGMIHGQYIRACLFDVPLALAVLFTQWPPSSTEAVNDTGPCLQCTVLPTGCTVYAVCKFVFDGVYALQDHHQLLVCKMCDWEPGG